MREWEDNSDGHGTFYPLLIHISIGINTLDRHS